MKRATRTIVGVLFAANAAVAAYACTGDDPKFGPGREEAGASDGGEEGAASEDGSVVDVHDGSAGDSDIDGGAVAPGRIFVFGGSISDGDGGQVMRADVLVTTVFPDGGLGAWQPAGVLPAPRRYTTAVSAAPDSVALVGGEGPSGFYGNVIRTNVVTSGLGAWSALGSEFPFPRVRHAATLQNGRVYILGGTGEQSLDGSVLDDVSSATIGAQSLGAWSGTTMPSPRSRMSVASTPSSIYLVGGADQAGVLLADIRRAVIAADGGLSYQPQMNQLPSPRKNTRSVVHGSFLIVTGGEVGSGLAEVLVYPIDPSGDLGPASTTTPMLRGVYHHAVVQYANRLYVIGGLNAEVHLANVIVGDLNADGTVAQWTETTPLPIPLAYHAAAVF